MRPSSERGFALVTVLGVILIVSAVALTVASTMRVEVLEVLGERQSLELDELAHSGQQMASYLVSRRLGTSLEDFEGLPVEAVQTGFHYIVHFPNGDVSLYLDSEDGKLNLSTTPDVVLEGSLTAWTGDVGRAHDLTAVVKDWRDLDDIPEPGGAEADNYVGLGYGPRNGQLGVADIGLLRGLTPEDFRDRLVGDATDLKRRVGLFSFLTLMPSGSTVNPNYASELALRGVPGLSPRQVERVIAERERGPFQDAPDFARRVGVSQDDVVWTYINFVRRFPGVLSIATSQDGRVVRSERRVTVPMPRLNVLTGLFEPASVEGLIERNSMPGYMK
jgi:type II secretory pathway component PulK